MTQPRKQGRHKGSHPLLDPYILAARNLYVRLLTGNDPEALNKTIKYLDSITWLSEPNGFWRVRYLLTAAKVKTAEAKQKFLCATRAHVARWIRDGKLCDPATIDLANNPISIEEMAARINYDAGSILDTFLERACFKD